MSGPNKGSLSRQYKGKFPLVYYTASYQINGGTDIAAGTAITDSVTFTGVLTTDAEIAIACRAAVSLNVNLQLTKAVVSATNTVLITWENVGQDAITPPSSATWSCAVLAPFHGG